MSSCVQFYFLRDHNQPTLQKTGQMDVMLAGIYRAKIVRSLCERQRESDERRNLDVETLSSQFVRQSLTGLVEVVHFSLQPLKHLPQLTDNSRSGLALHHRF